jgi:hypothetical protein
LACEGHGDAHCRPGEDSSGSTPVGSALSTHGNQPIVTRADLHHAYRPTVTGRARRCKFYFGLTPNPALAVSCSGSLAKLHA